MRIPAPVSLNIGVDVILRSRIASFGKKGPSQLSRFASRYLHPLELRDFAQRFPEWQDYATRPLNEKVRILNWLAGRWAAKEAAKKAWGASLIGFKDVRVELSETEKYIQIVCASYTSQKKESNSVEQAASLSISHDGEYVIAVVLAAPLDPDLKSELGRRKSEAEEQVGIHKLGVLPVFHVG